MSGISGFALMLLKLAWISPRSCAAAIASPRQRCCIASWRNHRSGCVERSSKFACDLLSPGPDNAERSKQKPVRGEKFCGNSQMKKKLPQSIARASQQWIGRHVIQNHRGQSRRAFEHSK